MKLYGIAYGFNIEAVIRTILRKILQTKILLVFCTDCKSLYNCFVKLKTTYKKRPMIEVMSFCQSYKRCEITEMKLIYRHNNFADLIIKNRLSSAFKTLIDTNRINIDKTE